jgi:hypothetical protein
MNVKFMTVKTNHKKKNEHKCERQSHEQNAQMRKTKRIDVDTQRRKQNAWM